ncbi:hypothetical protein K2173_006990 [Erythroxylum novogranatense]|uniref:LRAT domain-containing protein n=1 Tax=Erythroxylum novogranatense TaxID=1862640 RepID=A0AAV8SZL6_9ROSI|nr:hypothetical protein K2173_006990 [Erythroxylum novogranatense]
MEKLANRAVKAIWEMFPEEDVQNSQLEDGDHIYVYRAVGYSHHGIYVGRKDELQYVIHFGKDIPSCAKCGHKENHEVKLVITCLDCFCYERNRPLSTSLYRYRYGAGRLSLPGTCTTLKPKPSKEVVRVAYKLLEEGFGDYDLLFNNCEDFATYCKTGTARSSQATFVANSAALVGGATLAPLSMWFYFSKKKKEKRRG